MTSKLQKFTLIITLLLAGVILPLYAVKISLNQNYTDFQVYYRAAERALNHQWSEIYSLKDGTSPFRYAPPFIPFFIPFAKLSLSHAQLAWFFLQYFWFCLGFYFIYRSIRACQNRGLPLRATKPLRNNALWMTSLAVLFILRFCLDTFTIGQVSSLMFFGFSLGLFAWITRRPALAMGGLFIPTLFKIGPGFLFGLFLSSRPRERNRAILTGILAVLGIAGLYALWSFGWMGLSWSTNQTLWQGWMEMVAKDSEYYDSSHYGNQSLKSVLLRGVRFGWLTPVWADHIYVALAVLVCAGIALFWTLRRPRTFYGRGLFFSLGLFAYFWVMPETFKYSLTPLAIPVVFLFASPRKTLLTWFALIFGVFSLSLAGKDIVGDSIFFGNQLYSVPFMATLFLGAAIFQLAWKDSHSSWIARQLSRILLSHPRKLGPWEKFPSTERSLDVSLLIPIPFEKMTSLPPMRVEKLLVEAHELLRSRRFEILLIPFGDRYSEVHPLFLKLKSLKLAHVRLLPPSRLDGRGAALQAGFLESRGKKLLVSQIEQPCGVTFFEEAIKTLDSGYDLVRANRRDRSTKFQIPVRVLPLAYGRHRMGLWFNRLVKTFLPIQTTDTHSGTFGISWRLATDVFSVMSSPDFLFDLELSLTSLAQGYKEKDLPVTLSLLEEKPFQQILIETLSILRGLPNLALRYYKGYYQKAPTLQKVTSDDWGLSPQINEGILELAKLGVVKRVSILAHCRYVEHGLTELMNVPGVDLGLHFNLTYGVSSPGKFLLKWITNRRAWVAHVRSELVRQLLQLQKLGIQVKYLDGHHHIHLAPGMIDEIQDILHEYEISTVRIPYDPSLFTSPDLAPVALLAFLARRSVQKNGFRSSPCIYPKAIEFEDHGKLRSRLARHATSEVIVHPAKRDDLEAYEFPDVYPGSRITEFRTLRMLAQWKQ